MTKQDNVLVEKETWAVLGSDGSMEKYHDPYANQSENYESASKLQTYIEEKQVDLDSTFLKIGAALKIMREQELFRALGHPTFRSWANSPELSFTYRLAQDLIRLVEEIIPIYEENKELPSLPVSKMRELLPLVGSDIEGDIPEIIEEISGLSVRDSRERIKELRGIDAGSEAPIIFKAKVTRGDVYHRVTITRTGGESADVYEVTPQPIRIKVADWSRWLSRFSEGLVEYEQQE